MALNKLSARAVESVSKRGRYSDGGGLVLQISKWGTKSWIFRYERDGRDRHMGLGPLVDLSLAEARDKAARCRKLLLDGSVASNISPLTSPPGAIPSIVRNGDRRSRRTSTRSSASCRRRRSTPRS